MGERQKIQRGMRLRVAAVRGARRQVCALHVGNIRIVRTGNLDDCFSADQMLIYRCDRGPTKLDNSFLCEGTLISEIGGLVAS